VAQRMRANSRVIFRIALFSALWTEVRQFVRGTTSDLPL
jgi:hypothetical protein